MKQELHPYTSIENGIHEQDSVPNVLIDKIMWG